MSKIILPNQREVADVNKVAQDIAERQKAENMHAYFSAPISRGDMQQLAGQMINDALNGFLLFISEHFVLVPKTELGEQITAQANQPREHATEQPTGGESDGHGEA